MLDGLKRILTGGAGSTLVDPKEIQLWAAAQGFNFRSVHPGGFVIEGQLDQRPWRLEWGPPQRPFIVGWELRLRCDLGLEPDLQAAVMNRELQEVLEKQVFEKYVEGVQTRIDDQTPPEMRWLVMFPKLTANEMGTLRERYVALASKKSWLLRWMRSPFNAHLASHRVNAAVPLVFTVGRGRLTLRTEMPVPTTEDFQRWIALFEVALREAELAVEEFGLMPESDLNPGPTGSSGGSPA